MCVCLCVCVCGLLSVNVWMQCDSGLPRPWLMWMKVMECVKVVCVLLRSVYGTLTHCLSSFLSGGLCVYLFYPFIDSHPLLLFFLCFSHSLSPPVPLFLILSLSLSLLRSLPLSLSLCLFHSHPSFILPSWSLCELLTSFQAWESCSLYFCILLMSLCVCVRVCVCVCV